MNLNFKYLVPFLFWILFNYPVETKAYQLSGVKWVSGAFNFYINPIGVDNGVDYSSYSGTVISAVDKWEAVSTTDVQLNYLGTTSNTGWGINDGKNVITWKTDGWTGNVIGTSIFWYTGNSIVDSDIKLNTAFANDSRLTQLVTHETGHSLGIGHTREEGELYSQEEYDAIMYYLLHSQTGLNSEDKCAVTAIYPASQDCKPDYGTGYFDCIFCCSTGVVVSVVISDNVYTYDGSSKNVTVTTSPSGLSHTVGYFDQLSSPVINPTNAGTYNVVVTITESGYESEDPFYGTLTINKKALTVTSEDQTVDYGENEPAYTLAYNGFVSGEDQTFLTNQPSGYIVNSWPATPGNYTIYVGSGVDDNYSFNYSYGILTVNALSASNVLFTDKEYVYDGTDKDITVTTDPEGIGYNIEYKKDNNIVTDKIDAGSYQVTVTINETGYNADQFTDSLVIIRANLTVAANDTTVNYGSLEATYSLSYSGFAAGDDETDLTSPPTTYIEETWPVVPGQYTIHTDSGIDENYSFTYVEGTLTVEAIQVSNVSFSNNFQTYDGTNKEVTIATDPEGIHYDILYQVDDVITTSQINAGSYLITVEINETGYVSDQFTDSLIINKATLEVTARDTAITYGDDKPEIEITYSGFINGDSTTDLTEQATAEIPGTWPLSAGPHEIVITNGSDDNYTFSVSNGTLIINKALLEASVTDTTILEGDPEPTYSINYQGFVNDENTNVVDVLPVASVNEASPLLPGEYIIEINNGNDDNYEFDYTNGILTVIATHLVKVYASANGWISLSENGIQNDSIWERITDNDNSSSFYAIAEINYRFKEWDNGSIENPIVFSNVNEDISVTAMFESTVGVIDQSDIIFKIFPNPIEKGKGASVFIVLPKEFVANSTQLVIHDALGRVCYRKILPESSLKIPPFASGIYNLSILSGGKRIASRKLLVK